MLTQLRKQSSSFIVWLLFAIIILAFVFLFGPQAGPDMFSCQGAGNVGTVGGKAITQPSWRYAMGANGFGSEATYEQRHVAIDFLVERELLAQAAESRGFRMAEERVAEMMAKGEFLLLGNKIPAPWFDENGVLSKEQMLQVAQRLGLPSLDHLIREQAREHLAQYQRGYLFSQGQATADEAKASYINDNTTVKLDYARFGSARYSNFVDLDDKKVAVYAKALRDDIQKRWESETDRWDKDGKWARVQILFGKKEEGAQKRMERLQKRVASGADFGNLAKKFSEDKASMRRAGELGWRAEDSLGHGKELVEATEKLEIGNVTEVIETPRGFYIAKVLERKEGPLSLADKELDFAWDLSAQRAGLQAAEAEAKRALALAQRETLDDVFEKAPSAPTGFPSGGGGLSPKEQQKIIRQLEEQMKNQQVPSSQGPQSSNWVLGPEIPAQDGAGADAEKADAKAEPEAKIEKAEVKAEPEAKTEKAEEKAEPEAKNEKTEEKAEPEAKTGEAGATSDSEAKKEKAEEKTPEGPTAKAAAKAKAAAAKAKAAAARANAAAIESKAHSAAAANSKAAEETAARAAEESRKNVQAATDAEVKAAADAEVKAAAEAAVVELPAVSLSEKVDFPKLETVGPITRENYIRGIGESDALINAAFDTAPLNKVAPTLFTVKDPDGKTIAYVVARVTDRNKADLKAFKEDEAKMVSELASESGAEIANLWLAAQCKELATSKDVRIDPRYLDTSATATSNEVTYAPCSTLPRPRYQSADYLF